MLDNDVVSESIKEDKAKKRVSWNDKKDDGKINKEFLIIEEAASPCAATLEKEIDRLMAEENYLETEAAAYVGKPNTRNGNYIATYPFFYDSREDIKKQKEKRNNRSSFFSTQQIGYATVLLGVAAITLGIVITRNR